MKYYPQALKAYDMLVPKAYQADLFRYICLYIKGGVYLDCPIYPAHDIKLFRDIIGINDEFVSCLDLGIEK